MHIHHLRHVISDPVEIHRYALAGRHALLLLLAASLLTFVLARLYTRLARRHSWPSGRIGEVHVHHMVVGVVLVLASGMLDISLNPGDDGREILAVAFGVGGAFILDEFALTFHLRDVYWTEEGRRSIDACIMWMLLGALLLVGISPFGIHDKSVDPAHDRVRGDRDQHRALDRHLPEREADPWPAQRVPAPGRADHRDPARTARLGVGAALLPDRRGAAREGDRALPSRGVADRAASGSASSTSSEARPTSESRSPPRR